MAETPSEHPAKTETMVGTPTGAPMTPRIVPGSTDPVDRALLDRVTRGNNDKIRLLLSLFINQNGQHLQNLRRAITSDDVENVRQLAHAVAGASAFLGAAALSIPLFELEQMGKSGRLVPKSRDLIDQVDKEFARVQFYFDSLPPSSTNTNNAAA